MATRSQRQLDRGKLSRWIRGFSVALGVTCSAQLFSQSVLCVENNGKLERVCRYEGNHAVALESGKTVPIDGSHFVLQPAADYLPVCISIPDQKFQKGARAISDDGASAARLPRGGRFVFTGSLEAPRALNNVIMVLTLDSQQVGNSLFFKDVGHLDAHRIKRISIDETTQYKLSGVRLTGVHTFVDGKECFNSTILDPKWETVLNKMVASRIAAVQDADLKPLYVTDPVYPEAQKTKIAGKTVISCQIDEHGNVSNPSVVSETNPAFGAAAIEAIRHWRFVPQVKAGQPVPSTAQVPVDFSS